MISKNKLKYIRSLKEKKYRDQYGVFVAEGNKLVAELLGQNIGCEILIGTLSFIGSVDCLSVDEVIEVSDNEMSQVSYQKNPQQALGVFYKKTVDDDIDITSQLVLALDGIQDPGNLGTIVRLADWYGIKHVFCSPDTADIYNPKVVQATMGAIARVNIHYVDLALFIAKHSDVPVYGTLLDGQNMYEEEITAEGIIVMGNEGNGIRPEIQKLISHKLFIPGYPLGQQSSESLNVAIATAIVCAEFRRRIL